ncbi:hypothetical protein PSTG_12493 [Puccinia striiformis f. sp. tritici PST-78]|uniref:Uncharacterized protein n=1 Tax=Puccinia striiformis f. sp. tritici PST-78 TaxID=1165861 RepID=A0A0L0V4E0_9BASI|nr:hypothetical protein PSTG_12493 [Puccinia striiformis f. sp. tritici PST-78]
MGIILFQAPLHFVVFSGLGLIDIDLSLRQAPEYTMADSETESSSPTDTELNSETLTQLHKSATEVTGSFVILGYTLRASYDKNSLAYDHNLIPKRIQVISQTLDSTLVILAMYLIPLPGQTGHSPAANHYKARFVALQERWHCAIKNLSTTLLSFEGRHHQQRAAPEE